jgi:hypothetical protein
VQDAVDAGERGRYLGSKESVSVADYADFHLFEFKRNASGTGCGISPRKEKTVCSDQDSGSTFHT